MLAHAFIGNSLQRSSRYYLDPNYKNGECRIIKPADPVKLAALKEYKSQRKMYKSLNFYGKRNKAEINLVKKILNYDTLERIRP